MPLNQYFKGKGRAVLSDMRKKYGPRADQVFHATANKMKMRPVDSKMKKAMKHVLKRSKQRQ